MLFRRLNRVDEEEEGEEVDAVDFLLLVGLLGAIHQAVLGIGLLCIELLP